MLWCSFALWSDFVLICGVFLCWSVVWSCDLWLCCLILSSLIWSCADLWSDLWYIMLVCWQVYCWFVVISYADLLCNTILMLNCVLILALVRFCAVYYFHGDNTHFLLPMPISQHTFKSVCKPRQYCLKQSTLVSAWSMVIYSSDIYHRYWLST